MSRITITKIENDKKSYACCLDVYPFDYKEF